MSALTNWVAEHYEERGPAAWLAFGLEVFAGIIICLMMLLTCADVIGRYFFNDSVDGAVEMTEIAIALLVYAQMPVITWRGGHIVVDMLDRYLGSRLVCALGLLAALLVSTSFYVLADRLMELAERSLRRNVVTEYLQLPVGHIIEYIAVMSYVTAVLMITYGVYRLFREYRQH
ncbi:TRAP transporter small permease [Parathalassolituus penaei]|uniref:TRAP transporter small permease protein n=1 Tax=Parathalassolituus penaei TaxID=2997323 RepID=A0A9X3EH22_9GAMM|nr:TRAP transporter small permease [Parathalassolituus penaei]MCY0967394.1 TRAP transporter small permease [Parathalassolituus penaei]